MKVWLQAARPRTLVATISPILIGSTLAFSLGSFHFVTFLFTLLCALCIQIGTNFTNDYYDFKKGADTSSRKGPTRVMQAGLVTELQMQRAMIAAFSLAALFGSYLIWQGGAIFAVLLAISIAAGYLYTAGPYPLAYFGLGDLFVLIFFGPVATVGTYILQTKHFSWDACFVGLGPGALSWAILTLNNLRDLEEDKKASKKTLCVRFGKTFGKTLYVIALALALFCPLLFRKTHPGALLASLTFFLMLPLARQVIINEAFQASFAKTAALLLPYTLLFCCGWLL